MKNLLYLSRVLFLSLVLFFLTTSCQKENVELDSVKFIGTYSVAEQCNTSGTDSYEITIRQNESKGDNDIILTNLYKYGKELEATVSGNSITIPSQTVTITYSGSGTLNDDVTVLTIDFKVTDSVSGSTDDCVATGTKK